MQNPIEKLYESNMDRREFLLNVGAGLTALVGISSIIRALTGAGSQSHSAPKAGYGYSSGAYGGEVRRLGKLRPGLE